MAGTRRLRDRDESFAGWATAWLSATAARLCSAARLWRASGLLRWSRPLLLRLRTGTLLARQLASALVGRRGKRLRQMPTTTRQCRPITMALGRRRGARDASIYSALRTQYSGHREAAKRHQHVKEWLRRRQEELALRSPSIVPDHEPEAHEPCRLVNAVRNFFR
jgi:hypothetical protein